MLLLFFFTKIKNLCQFQENKIEGTPILKLAMVIYSSKFDKRNVENKQKKLNNLNFPEKHKSLRIVKKINARQPLIA